MRVVRTEPAWRHRQSREGGQHSQRHVYSWSWLLFDSLIARRNEITYKRARILVYKEPKLEKLRTLGTKSRP
jgi:hypothetical protein